MQEKYQTPPTPKGFIEHTHECDVGTLIAWLEHTPYEPDSDACPGTPESMDLHTVWLLDLDVTERIEESVKDTIEREALEALKDAREVAKCDAAEARQSLCEVY
jgi:hypothetical protein